MDNRTELVQHHAAQLDALRAGRESLKQEGAEALAYSLDQARCNRKYAAAEVVNRFRAQAAELVGTEAFPSAQVDIMSHIARLSGVLMEAGAYFSDEQRTAIDELVAAGWVKYVTETLPDRAVAYFTIDFGYQDLDRTNG